MSRLAFLFRVCRPRYIATTNASAQPPSCARLTAHWVSPRSAASVAAAPWSRRRGQRHSSSTTSISRNATGPIPVPSAFATASFAAQRAASESGAPLARGQLVRREHTTKEPLAVALDHPGNTCGLNQVSSNS